MVPAFFWGGRGGGSVALSKKTTNLFGATGKVQRLPGLRPRKVEAVAASLGSNIAKLDLSAGPFCGGGCARGGDKLGAVSVLPFSPSPKKESCFPFKVVL